MTENVLSLVYFFVLLILSFDLDVLVVWVGFGQILGLLKVLVADFESRVIYFRVKEVEIGA